MKSWKRSSKLTSLALNCDRCSFFLNDADTGEPYSRVAQGIRRREIRLLNNDGVIGAAFQTGRSIIIGNAYADPRFNPTTARLATSPKLSCAYL